MVDTAGPLYAKLFEFEPDVYTGDPSLAAFFPRVIPDQSTQLVLPRPKLVRGQYEPLNPSRIGCGTEGVEGVGRQR